MQNVIADVSRARNQRFSLVEVAVAVALLSIATAVSLPQFNRLAGHGGASVAAPSAANRVVQGADSPRPAPRLESAPAAVPVKLMDLIRGYPADSADRGLINWGGFAPSAVPTFPAIAATKAPSGRKCAPPDDATRAAKNAAAGGNLDTHGC